MESAKDKKDYEDYKFLHSKFYSPTMCMVIHEEEVNFDDEFAKVELLDEIPRWGRIDNPEQFKVRSLALGSKFLGGWYFQQNMPKHFWLNKRLTPDEVTVAPSFAVLRALPPAGPQVLQTYPSPSLVQFVGLDVFVLDSKPLLFKS